MIDIDYITGSAVALFIALTSAWFIRYIGRKSRPGGWDVTVGERRSLKAVPITVLCLTILIWTTATWPTFDLRYQTWEPVSGTVTDVGRRMLAEDGKATEEKVVVRLDDGGEYGCIDTRCTLIEPGNHVELLCLPKWIYAAPDGYDCRYVSSSDPQ